MHCNWNIFLFPYSHFLKLHRNSGLMNFFHLPKKFTNNKFKCTLESMYMHCNWIIFLFPIFDNSCNLFEIQTYSHFLKLLRDSVAPTYFERNISSYDSLDRQVIQNFPRFYLFTSFNPEIIFPLSKWIFYQVFVTSV